MLLTSVSGDYVQVGIKAGPLSQWLVNGLRNHSGCTHPVSAVLLD